MLQCEKLKHYMVTIRLYRLLTDIFPYKHKFLDNINKLYKSAGKFDDEQK